MIDHIACSGLPNMLKLDLQLIDDHLNGYLRRSRYGCNNLTLAIANVNVLRPTAKLILNLGYLLSKFLK